jgi:hypothetical protein
VKSISGNSFKTLIDGGVAADGFDMPSSGPWFKYLKNRFQMEQ